MDPVERIVQRVIEAIWAPVLALLFTAIGQALEPIPSGANYESTQAEFIAQLIPSLLQSLPGLLTLAGLIIATLVAGPLGILGIIMEIAGANLIFNGNADGIWLIFLGALFVVGGRFVPWGKLVRAYLQTKSNRGYRRRR